MRTNYRASHYLRWAGLVFWMSMFCTLVVPGLRAQSDDEFDSYKVRLEGYWVYSTPSGILQGSANSAGIDLTKDFHFDTYSTAVGKLDWRFTRKNHLYIMGIPFNSSSQVNLMRTINFQGKTFVAGLSAHASLDSPVYIVGYQHDIIRRKRGHLGIGARMNIFDTHASISAAAQVVGGMQQAAIHASGSLVAPIPVAGPDFRLYLTDSPRLFIDGNLYGMYFFGYGNYASTSGDLGFSITKHFSVNAGYQLGSRLVVNNNASTNRIGLTMKQKGPLVGFQYTF